MYTYYVHASTYSILIELLTHTNTYPTHFDKSTQITLYRNIGCQGLKKPVAKWALGPVFLLIEMQVHGITN